MIVQTVTSGSYKLAWREDAVHCRKAFPFILVFSGLVLSFLQNTLVTQ